MGKDDRLICVKKKFMSSVVLCLMLNLDILILQT